MEQEKSKGYVFAVCQNADDPYICGALHVERDGVKLLYGISYVEDGVYLDTLENRQLLGLYSREMQRTLLNRKNPHKGYDR